jgi:hypothetical protein
MAHSIASALDKIAPQGFGKHCPNHPTSDGDAARGICRSQAEVPHATQHPRGGSSSASSDGDATRAHQQSHTVESPKPTGGGKGLSSPGLHVAPNRPSTRDSALHSTNRPWLLHVCGKAHCEYGLGIPEHLRRMAPHARVLVVVFVPLEGLLNSRTERGGPGNHGCASDSLDRSNCRCVELCQACCEGAWWYVAARYSASRHL